MSRDKRSAKLISISRGFGGDTAIYDSLGVQIVVSVSWGLLAGNATAILIDGKIIGEFSEERSIQPAEALSLLGYEVHGSVDFSAYTEAVLR